MQDFIVIYKYNGDVHYKIYNSENYNEIGCIDPTLVHNISIKIREKYRNESKDIINLGYLEAILYFIQNEVNREIEMSMEDIHYIEENKESISMRLLYGPTTVDLNNRNIFLTCIEQFNVVLDQIELFKNQYMVKRSFKLIFSELSTLYPELILKII